jgi:hypothetical protein
VHENLHRLIELLNLQWLLQNRDRTDLKNPIEDLAIWVTCDHDLVFSEMLDVGLRVDYQAS